MKYVIKEATNKGYSYLKAENYLINRSSTFVYSIADATKFDSIRDAIDVIRLRDSIYASTLSGRTPFTIVGVEEAIIPTPVYKEVIL